MMGNDRKKQRIANSEEAIDRQKGEDRLRVATLRGK